MFTRFIALFSICFLPLFSNAQCAGTFTYTVNGLTVSFDGTVTPAPTPNTTYYWWFSDNNNSSSQEDPTYTFSGPGTYIVCFSFWDAVTQCADSLCMPVTVGSSSCTADFTSADSLPYIFFFSTTTAGNNAMYFWDFGDGNYANTANPSHVYGAPGYYQVCLTVYDSMQNFCDSTCHTILVQLAGVAEEEFVNTLSSSPNPADESFAISFNANSSGVGTITFFDATGRLASEKSVSHTSGTNRTEINTSTLPTGVYLVRIMVNGNVGWTRIAITHQSQR